MNFNIFHEDKNNICMAFLDGNCPYGNKCKYSHDIEKIKNLINKMDNFKEKLQKKERYNELKSYLTQPENNVDSSCFSFYNYEDKSIINNNSSSNLNLFDNINITNNENNLDDIINKFNNISSNYDSNICKDFLLGKCYISLCNKIHGYSENFIYKTFINLHNKLITNIIKISNEYFLTSDENCFKIHYVSLKKFETLFTVNIENDFNDKQYISNIFFSNLLIFICVTNKFNKTSLIQIYYSLEKEEFKNYIKVKSNNEKINSIIFLPKDNLFLVFGLNSIEVFLIKDFDVNLYKLIPIEIGINSVILINKIFICGLKSGQVSLLESDQTGENFFNQKAIVKLHKDEITSMYVKTVSENTHYLITGGKDKYFKVFNIEMGFIKVFEVIFSFGVNNIFCNKDRNKNEYFFVSLENGTIQVLNQNCEIIFDIPNRNNVNIKRMGIVMPNHSKNKEESDTVILNDGMRIECNVWKQKKL